MSASAPDSTRDAVLSLLLERGEEDAGALAGAVGISVQAMRRHLRSLADSGLVCASSRGSTASRGLAGAEALRRRRNLPTRCHRIATSCRPC